MKNFFKKLSFVMALAMVLTALAPAVAGADASYIYKRGNDTQKEALEVYFGDADEKRDLNVKINGKKTNDGTWKIGNKAIATIDENGVVTPVKNGTTTAKFTAEDGTVAKVKVVVGTRAAGVKVKDNGVAVTELTLVAGEEKELKFGAYISGKAKNAGATKASQEVTMTAEGEAVTTTVDGKYVTVKAEKAGEATLTFTAGKKTATVAVTVVESLAAEQAGAAKIKVTGSNLSDKVADYVVKRGTVVTSIKSVTLNEDKTEAVLTTAASKLTKGNYTLSFNGSEAVEFTAVEAVVANIEITSEVAVLKTGSTTQATANYKITNQFGEDITKNNSLTTSDKLTISGAVFTEAGKVTFTSTTPYVANLSVVALTVVCNTNGVNASKTLTVSAETKLNSVEFVGVRQVAGGVVVKEVALKERANDLTGLYLLFAAKDQYGNPYTAVNTSNMNVVISGISGLAVGEATVVRDAAYNYYVAYPLAFAPNYSALMAGSNTVMGIVLTNGQNVQGTVDVEAVSKIASISILTNEVYDAKTNVLEYEILDTNGNPVTSFVALRGLSLPTGVSFKRNNDGTARMEYVTDQNNTTDIPVVLTFQSETYNFTSVTMTLRPECKATTIAVAPTASLGAVGGNNIVIYSHDLVVLDQYGNTMSPVGVKVSATAGTPSNAEAFGSVTEHVKETAIAAAYNAPVATIGTVDKKIGTVEITLAIVGVENSECTATVMATDIEKVSNFAVKDMGLLHSATTGVAITVTGTVGNTTVTIPASYYTVVETNADTITTPVINNNGVPTTKSMTFNVVINNQAGTQISKTVEYSDIAPIATTVALKTDGSAKITATNNADGVTAAELVAMLNVKDQYGEGNAIDTVRVQVTGINPLTTTVTNNNTVSTVVNGLSAADVAIHVVYTFAYGAVFETDIPVVIE